MTAVPTCPACNTALHEHPFCVRCRRLHHEPCRDPELCKGCDAALAKHGLRRCKIGGEIKPLAAFAKERGSAKFYRACRSCRGKRPQVRAAVHAYYARNQARLQAYAREYCAAHRETIRQAKRQYYLATRARRLRYGAAWRAANRERHAAYSRAYRARHRAACNAATRARYQQRKLQVWFGTRAGGAG